MALTIGTQVGSHEIIALLGKGGMGEVYRARDTKLKRDVAIKILPDEFSLDPDRISRFQREAEVLASLNHPHIAAIHSLEQANGSRFLVLELVEGQTLAERMQRGALPIDEALTFAKHICEALEAAHEKGIVHRDLKPGNVKITPEAQVKVLDFGLAKALDSAPTNPALSNSPTLSMATTNPGIVLGTAAYMSPEQAKGRVVDRRADIFAFGCVLYEMLTGQAAFDGEDVTEILGRVVTAEPDWSRLPAGTPAAIRQLLRRALKKDPRQRLGDIRDARIEIEELGLQAEPDATRRSTAAAWIAAVAIAAVVIAALAIPTVRHLRETEEPEMRLEINTLATAAPYQFAVSPSGRYIVFVGTGDGRERLWLRALDKPEAQPIAGTEGAQYPFWSPDSRSIGFFASAKLQRVDIAGGPPQALAPATGPLGGTWNADGTILFGPSTGVGLARVATSGGDEVPVTHVSSPRQARHSFPQFLPDGRHFLFLLSSTSPDVQGIYVGSLDGGEPKRLTPADAAGAYLPPDRLMFIRQGALVARRLDIARGELTETPLTVADPVGYETNLVGGFSASADGRVVAYRAGGAGRRQLVWFDRMGKAVGVVGEPDANNMSNPELSPDGRSLAVQRTLQGNPDIWLMDLVRGSFTRFTFDGANDNYPVWSPDGTRIAFRSDRKGIGLYVKPSSMASPEELLLETANTKVPQDWSKDGRFLLYYEVDPKTARDVWTLDMTGTERKARPVVNTPFEETVAQFSADGHWLAYQTNDSGQPQIVVQAFPGPGGKWQISTNGGSQPRWRADGKELYFIAPDGKLMAVPVTASHSTFEPGKPVALFQTHILSGSAGTVNRAQYAVSRDGRFLMNQPVEGSIASPITVLLNWKPDGKK
jgi:eukaryotic-like serine/threonine-protein kinase